MPFFSVFFGPSPSFTDLGRTNQAANNSYHMGKQGDIKLRGRVDNIIYYQWNGIHCMRTVPARVRQSDNTKAAATKFGLAVKSAAALRSLLKPVLPDPTNNAIRYEFDGAFRKWLHTDPLERSEPEDMIPSFADFSFNKAARPGKIFRMVKVTRANDHDLLIQLPAFNPLRDVTAPKETGGLQLNFFIAVLPFNGQEQKPLQTTNLDVPYVDKLLPAYETIIPEVTGPGALALALMQMRYVRGNQMAIDQMRWKPMGIVGCFYN